MVPEVGTGRKRVMGIPLRGRGMRKPTHTSPIAITNKKIKAMPGLGPHRAHFGFEPLVLVLGRAWI